MVGLFGPNFLCDFHVGLFRLSLTSVFERILHFVALKKPKRTWSGLCTYSLFHLGLLGLKGIFFEPPFEKSSLVSIAGGIVTYFFIGIMLLTSFHFFSARISAKLWSRIHTVGGYTILFIFTLAYIKHSVQSFFFIPLLMMAVGVWAFRFMNMKRHASA